MYHLLTTYLPVLPETAMIDIDSRDKTQDIKNDMKFIGIGHIHTLYKLTIRFADACAADACIC